MLLRLNAPVLAALLVALCFTATAEKNILVFGGNGFIGSELVLKLAERGYRVFTTNRGNWYWDSPVRVKPSVYHHVTCDRTDGYTAQGIKYCYELRAYWKDLFFDAVVDLSAYDGEAVQDATEQLRNKTSLYIYISSDSVYMVCQKPEYEDQDKRDGDETENDVEAGDSETEGKGEGEEQNAPPRTEDQAHRPNADSTRERLNNVDPYGHRKLSGEETLIKQRKHRAKGKTVYDGVPYVILRVPDVIGSRDTTDRFWQYQMWIQFYKYIRRPLIIPSRFVNRKTSYIYVHDVVKAILAAIDKNETVWDQVFNLGFEEPMELHDLLERIRKGTETEDVQYDIEDSLTAYHVFPSVTFGSVNISKAKSVLGFQPVTWEEALNDTIDFYNAAYTKFPVQRDTIAKRLLYHVIPEENKELFVAALAAEVKLRNEASNNPDEEPAPLPILEEPKQEL